MKISKAVIILSILAGLFGLVQAGAGLFWQTAGAPLGDHFQVRMVDETELRLENYFRKELKL